MSGMLIPDFGVLSFCGEIRENRGEDCRYFGFRDTVGMIAVFDGCGGSGAQIRRCFGGHTDAYMASRAAASAAEKWMQESRPSRSLPDMARRTLQPRILQELTALIPEEEQESGCRGFLTLPTTMAALMIEGGTQDVLTVTSVSAGDSRNYLLTPSGLHQLSRDDSDQPDPFEDLYDEGAITNIINCGKDFSLNFRTLQIPVPCILLSATDGCFAYVSTPMEFEGMLLHTLLESSDARQWEHNLHMLVQSFAGDDHTLCLASFGYPGFGAMQDAFRSRYDLLQEQYLHPVWAAAEEDRDLRRKLWMRYRTEYMRFLGSDDT